MSCSYFTLQSWLHCDIRSGLYLIAPNDSIR